MSRHNFYEVKRISISTLLLDTYNPRIRHGQDQKDCIVRILRDRDNFLSLLKDIAANGLSIEHIIISKNETGKWIVRDGNRRVTALKLLNRPSLALPDTALVNLITRIQNAHIENIPKKVNCMTCDDEDTISSFLMRKHTGANAGIGQKAWSAVLISLFNLHAGITDQNRRAAQLLLWAEENGLQIEDDFPITTLTRGLNADTLEIIGFEIKDECLIPTIPIQKAYAIVERVINDIAHGHINVKRDSEEGSIFTKENQRKYFRKVRDLFSDMPDTSEQEPKSNQAPTENQLQNEPNTNNQLQETFSADKKQRQKKPIKPAWDRPCIFGRRKGSAPDFIIPDSEPKAISVVAELKGLNPTGTPIATAMMLRYLIELSNAHYRQVNSLRQLDTLHKSIANSAEHMKNTGLVSQEQLDVILRYTLSEQSMLHIKTLQAYIHRANFHPNGQAINTFWDEIGCFVLACWAR